MPTHVPYGASPLFSVPGAGYDLDNATVRDLLLSMTEYHDALIRTEKRARAMPNHIDIDPEPESERAPPLPKRARRVEMDASSTLREVHCDIPREAPREPSRIVSKAEKSRAALEGGAARVSAVSEDAYEVVVECERDVCAGAHVKLPWIPLRHTPGFADFVFVVPRNLVIARRGVACGFCKGPVDDDTQMVRGCDSAHDMHLPCWAIVQRRYPESKCAGCVVSARVASAPVRCSPASIAQSRERMLAVMNSVMAKDVVRAAAATDRANHAMSAISNDALWRDDPAVVTSRARRRAPGETGRKCCACDAPIDDDDTEAIAPCSAHHAHASCFAVFKAVQRADPVCVFSHDCPAAMVRLVKCSHAVSASR